MAHDTTDTQDAGLEYYLAKATCWLEDHKADEDADPRPLAEWASKHEGAHWAAVAQDGSIVGEADPVSDPLDEMVVYYATAETSKRYHLDGCKAGLRLAADMAIGEIQRAVGMGVIWARTGELSGHLWPDERDRYLRALARKAQAVR